MSERLLSASASELAKLVARTSAAYVAREVGCDESAIRNWARGRRTPNEAMRARLGGFDSRLSPGGWGAETTPAAPAKSSPAKRPATRSKVAPPVVAPDDGEARLLEVIAECDRLAEEAADPDANVPMRDRVQILGAKSSAVVRLSRIRGEDALSMQKFMKTRWYRELEQLVVEIVQEADPTLGALHKFIKRLEELDARDRGRA